MKSEYAKRRSVDVSSIEARLESKRVELYGVEGEIEATRKSLESLLARAARLRAEHGEIENELAKARQEREELA